MADIYTELDANQKSNLDRLSDTLRRYVLSEMQKRQLAEARLEAEQREHDRTKLVNLQQANKLEIAKRGILSAVRALFSPREIIDHVTKWEVKK